MFSGAVVFAKVFICTVADIPIYVSTVFVLHCSWNFDFKVSYSNATVDRKALFCDATHFTTLFVSQDIKI